MLPFIASALAIGRIAQSGWPLPSAIHTSATALKLDVLPADDLPTSVTTQNQVTLPASIGIKLAPSPTRPLLFLIAAFVGSYLLFFHPPGTLRSSYSLFALLSPQRPMSATSAQGWHARAIPHPSPSFTPTKDAFVFAVLLNALVDQEGFTMALFQPDVAIDARGRVLQPQPQDFATLATLAQEATCLPDTGSFMNAWCVSHGRTSRKTDRLFSKTSGDGDIKETSVQGCRVRRGVASGEKVSLVGEIR